MYIEFSYYVYLVYNLFQFKIIFFSYNYFVYAIVD